MAACLACALVTPCAALLGASPRALTSACDSPCLNTPLPAHCSPTLTCATGCPSPHPSATCLAVRPPRSFHSALSPLRASHSVCRTGGGRSRRTSTLLSLVSSCAPCSCKVCRPLLPASLRRCSPLCRHAQGHSECDAAPRQLQPHPHQRGQARLLLGCSLHCSCSHSCLVADGALHVDTAAYNVSRDLSYLVCVVAAPYPAPLDPRTPCRW